MTNKELFLTIVERLKTEPFLKGFKFRKRDSSFIKQEGGLRRHIELDHWSKEGVLIIYPIYMVRFDVLLKWFEPYNVKSPQDQQDNPSVGFTGDMLGRISLRFQKPIWSVNTQNSVVHLPTVPA